MKWLIGIISIAFTVLSPSQDTAPVPLPRTWRFEQDGKMESDSGSLSFKKGGRMDAVFVRIVDTNTVLLRPVGFTTTYSVSVTNLCGEDRNLLLHAPELLRKGNQVVALSPAFPKEAVPETLVLSNSDAFYEWEKVKSSVTGTLTVETFEPRIKLTIRNCHYEANQWKTNTEVSKTSSAVFTRICPTTNLVIKAWCVSTNILHLQNGKAVAIEKLYDCSPAP
jgi:hypothetical protein